MALFAVIPLFFLAFAALVGAPASPRIALPGPGDLRRASNDRTIGLGGGAL